jgi:hypothetical protein
MFQACVRLRVGVEPFQARSVCALQDCLADLAYIQKGTNSLTARLSCVARYSSLIPTSYLCNGVMDPASRLGLPSGHLLCLLLQ